MINKCAERLKAWGKEIKRGHDAAMFDALPQILKDKIEKEIKEMTPKSVTEPQVFIVGREHSLKIGEFVYIKEPVGDRRYATLYTTGDKEKAYRFTDPSEAQRMAYKANNSAPTKYPFTVGLPEQFRSDITASQREAHRQHKLEEARARKMQEIASTGVSTEEAERALKSEPTPFAKFYASRTDEERCGGISDALDFSEKQTESEEDYDARVRANIAAANEESKVKKVDFMHCQKCGKDMTEGLCEHVEDKLVTMETPDGTKILNRKDLDKIFEPYNAEHVEFNAIVERPAHYNQGAIDVIEALYQLLTWEQFKGFMQGNIIKYTVRFEDKDDPIIDLEKAEYYSKRLREYRMRHREAELAEKSKDWGIK